MNVLPARMLRKALLLLSATLGLSLPSFGQIGFICDCFDPQQAPCGNGIPTALWGGCINSLGAKGNLFPVQGSTNVLVDDLVLGATPLRPGSFGLLFMGPHRQRTPLGDGQLCVSGGGVGTFRFAAQATNPDGLALIGPGLVNDAAMRFGPNGQIRAGDTWVMQYWYRDVGGPCGSGFNLTNGLVIAFQ